MKYLYLIISCLIFSNGFSQNETKKHCLIGIQKAQIDFKCEDIKIFRTGFVHIVDKVFDEFYRQFLKEKYNITIDPPNNMSQTEIECYKGKMEFLLKEKYGSDFFESVNNEAKTAYKKLK